MMELLSLSDIKIWDVLDVLIVAYLMYVIYKLLRGTIAVNIFVGVLLLYLIYWLVGILDMKLLSLLLGKFVGFGVIILIIIFQPEVRKFLLILGNNTLKGRFNFINRFFKDETTILTELEENRRDELYDSMSWLSKQKMGALIVISKTGDWKSYASQGVELDAEIHHQLVESIFYKNSPLHDGAMVIIGQRIKAVSAILPITQRKNLEEDLGLRHRAGIGVTELTDACSFMVSEETGEISMAVEGKLTRKLSKETIIAALGKYL